MNAMNAMTRSVVLSLVFAGYIQAAAAGGFHSAPNPQSSFGVTHVAQDSATQEFQSAMTKMQERMKESQMSGDADRDFAMHMIPHHQGAIDMARIQLEHGKDPELRKMAEKVIADQEKEIAQLNDWLAKH